ncbi:MAG: DUF308 domain-containing protein [Clostridiales bacterium]|nr:DUF308 domain-containing protein [Clostridiales bacterium]
MGKKRKNASLSSLSGYISWLLAVLWLLLGLFFAIWPSFSSGFLCFLVAFLLTACGAVTFLWNCRKLTRQTDYPYSIELSAVFVAVGVWIFLNSKTFLSMVPILCGVLLFIHGLVDGLKAWKLNQRKQEFWWTALIAGGILLILAVVLFFNPFKAMASTLRFAGIALIFNGLADIWLCFCLSFAGKHSLREEAFKIEENVKEASPEDEDEL